MWQIVSPNGRLAAEVELDTRGALELRLAHEGRPVIRSAALGLRTGAGALREGLKAAGCETAEIDERYSLPAGKLAEYACRAR